MVIHLYWTVWYNRRVIRIPVGLLGLQAGCPSVLVPDRRREAESHGLQGHHFSAISRSCSELCFGLSAVSHQDTICQPVSFERLL